MTSFHHRRLQEDWLWHQNQTWVMKDEVIETMLAGIQILSDMREPETAHIFAKDLYKRTESEYFIRSIGRAANLDTLQDDIQAALGSIKFNK